MHIPSIHISLRKRESAIAFFDRAGRALREDLIILIGLLTIKIIIINKMTKYFCYSLFRRTSFLCADVKKRSKRNHLPALYFSTKSLVTIEYYEVQSGLYWLGIAVNFTADRLSFVFKIQIKYCYLTEITKSTGQPEAVNRFFQLWLSLNIFAFKHGLRFHVGMFKYKLRHRGANRLLLCIRKYLTYSLSIHISLWTPLCNCNSR